MHHWPACDASNILFSKPLTSHRQSFTISGNPQCEKPYVSYVKTYSDILNISVGIPILTVAIKT